MFFFIVFCLTSCNLILDNNSSSPQAGDPDNPKILSYQTKHFIFLFMDNTFAMADVIANGKVKEAHLTRINSELNVNFSGQIIVRLIESSGEWGGRAHPQMPYLIQETKQYFIRDSGHEVVHAVVFETLGHPSFSFFVEGLAVAHELSDIPRWYNICRHNYSESELYEKLDKMLLANKSEDIDYPIAGAYVQWMEREFGLEPFKTFYQDLSHGNLKVLENAVSKNFGLSVEKLNKSFYTKQWVPAHQTRQCKGY